MVAMTSIPKGTRGCAALLAAVMVTGATGCSSASKDISTAPMPDAVAVAHTAGPRSTTVVLSKPIEAYLLNASCTGKGSMSYTYGTAGGGGEGTISCPGTMNAPGISEFGRTSVKISIISADTGVTGIVQIAPVQS